MGTIHLGRDSTAGFDPVATAVEECYGTTRYFSSSHFQFGSVSFEQWLTIMTMMAVLKSSFSVWVSQVPATIDNDDNDDVDSFELLIVSVGQLVSSNG